MLRCRLSATHVAFAALLSVSMPFHAQSKTAKAAPAPASFGAVAGHVFFAGNSLPVRFAQVALQPIEVKSATTGKAETPSFQVYQTDLAGAFQIDRVPPGVYFVVVKYPGCLSPFAAFTQSELEHPTPEQERLLAAAVPTVSVSPNNAAAVNVRLEQGASIGGNVRFDDGTPFVNALVSVKKHGSDGTWAAPRATEVYTEADTGGHWQIGGLPPGEYRVEVLLRIEERHQSSLLSDNTSSWNNTLFSVAVYFGDTERARDAKTVTLSDNQRVDNQDVTIPIAKMHTLTGAIVDARTGQALNAGRVSLADGEDDTEITSAAIDAQTRTFVLPFIPEGTYKLKTKDAREARIESIPLEEGSFGTPQFKTTTLREYAPGEVPLIVQGEMSGVSLAVSVKSAKAQ